MSPGMHENWKNKIHYFSQKVLENTIFKSKKVKEQIQDKKVGICSNYILGTLTNPTKPKLALNINGFF